MFMTVLHRQRRDGPGRWKRWDFLHPKEICRLWGETAGDWLNTATIRQLACSVALMSDEEAADFVATVCPTTVLENVQDVGKDPDAEGIMERLLR
jgi:hypothetical protein